MAKNLLTADDVRLIQDLWEEKQRMRDQRDAINQQLKELTYVKIAEKFEVSRQTVEKALRGMSMANTS